MLTDKIDEAINLIEASLEQAKEIEENNRIERIYKSIEDNEKKLLRPYRSIANLDGYLGSLELFEAKNAIYHLIYNINNLMKDVSNVKKRDIDELGRMAEDADEKIKISWQDYMKLRNSDLIDSLDLIEKLVDDIVKVHQLRHSLENIGESWPVNKSQIEKYEVAVDESTKLIDQLDIKDNIKVFLKLVMNGEATLEDIDEDIYEWLKKQKVLSKMKIVYDN